MTSGSRTFSVTWRWSWRGRSSAPTGLCWLPAASTSCRPWLGRRKMTWWSACRKRYSMSACPPTMTTLPFLPRGEENLCGLLGWPKGGWHRCQWLPQHGSGCAFYVWVGCKSLKDGHVHTMPALWWRQSIKMLQLAFVTAAEGIVPKHFITIASFRAVLGPWYSSALLDRKFERSDVTATWQVIVEKSFELSCCFEFHCCPPHSGSSYLYSTSFPSPAPHSDWLPHSSPHKEFGI